MEITEKNRLLEEIRSYGFTVLELALYLDTHPNDVKALRLYGAVSDKLKELQENYEQNYGPLTITGVNSGDGWTWINGPWPWE